MYATVCKSNPRIGTKFSNKKEKFSRSSNTILSMNQDKIPHTNSRQRLVKGNRNNLQQSGFPSGVTSSVVQE